MYPTKRQILANKPKIKEKTLETVLSWKKEFLKNWKNTPKKLQLTRLEVLLIVINLIETGNLNINIKNSNRYSYKPKTKTIYQDKNHPSIISALHELGHHIFGPSELKTCKWSVWVFKECFPIQYKNLRWEKHTLIKK